LRRVGFESAKRSHCQNGFTDSKGLGVIRVPAFLASFGFVLAYFSGRFDDSIGLSGFVLQNFRFFFFAFSRVAWVIIVAVQVLSLSHAPRSACAWHDSNCNGVLESLRD
jgi:hypothetical protein